MKRRVHIPASVLVRARAELEATIDDLSLIVAELKKRLAEQAEKLRAVTLERDHLAHIRKAQAKNIQSAQARISFLAARAPRDIQALAANDEVLSHA